ncbi:hypothetical protein CFC21_100467 [Triticum aestivum]|uniref:RNase H type-1 domain-containing protein n=2 Tax=Triticum aestivum TaxID=4565 RepID=A0A3B6RNK0_WHEAT|nr:hypothetical protein CFC21_100467 [Triticum aestivum]
MDAVDEGLRLALHWSNLPLTMEIDCAKLLQLIPSRDVGRSRYAYQVSEIRMILVQERNISLAKISRHTNAASHTLTCMGWVQQQTACWLRNFPNEIASIVKSECKHLSCLMKVPSPAKK